MILEGQGWEGSGKGGLRWRGLGFLSLGARGSTLTEILEGLKFNLTETPETEIHRGFQHILQTLHRPSNELQLSVGNAMFVQEQLTLLDKFREDTRVLYSSEAFPTEFNDSNAAMKLINDYVKNKTQGKIEDLAKSLKVKTPIPVKPSDNCIAS